MSIHEVTVYTNKPPRLIVVGCGSFSHNHVSAWAECGCRPIAVVDTDVDRAQAMATQHGIGHAYGDLATALAEQRPDVVDIVAGPGAHKGLVEVAVSAGIDVIDIILQKPIADTWAACLDIVRCAKNAQVPITVHENFRYQAPIQTLMGLISGIGPVHAGHISFRTPYDLFTTQPYLAASTRFILADLGVHLFDVARFLFGEIRDLGCLTRKINPRILGEDMAHCLINHDSGIISTLDCSYASVAEPDPFPQTLITVEGRDGTLRLERDYRIRCERRGHVEYVCAPPTMRSWMRSPGEVVQDSVVNFCADWLAHRRQGTKPGTILADHLRSTACVEAAYASAAVGGARQQPRTLIPSDCR